MKEPSETKFHKWLDKLLVAHVFIDSEIATFAEAFRKITKRADFIVFPDGKKPYCVDVKEKSLKIREGFEAPTFEIDRYCIEKLGEFQKLYRMRVWLALTPDHNKGVWYFIDLHHVEKLPRRFHNHKKYVYIPYCNSAQESCYKWCEDGVNKGFFVNYLTKNSPEFDK